MIENSRKMLGAYDPEDVHLLAGGGGGVGCLVLSNLISGYRPNLLNDFQ